MIDIGKSSGLQTIFSLFLGLMVTAFVGVGVYTFYPPPDQAYDARFNDLETREREMGGVQPREDLSDTERAELATLDSLRQSIQDEREDARESWGRTSSIILIIFATIAMAISLGRADQLPVISNGLLVGGLFTMVYGVGWSVATDESVPRFIVITIAFCITLALGYLRFVRNRKVGGEVEPAEPPGGGDASHLEQRLRTIEDRMQRVGRLLSEGDDRSQRTEE